MRAPFVLEVAPRLADVREPSRCTNSISVGSASCGKRAASRDAWSPRSAASSDNPSAWTQKWYIDGYPAAARSRLRSITARCANSSAKLVAAWGTRSRDPSNTAASRSVHTRANHMTHSLLRGARWRAGLVQAYTRVSRGPRLAVDAIVRCAARAKAMWATSVRVRANLSRWLDSCAGVSRRCDLTRQGGQGQSERESRLRVLLTLVSCARSAARPSRPW